MSSPRSRTSRRRSNSNSNSNRREKRSKLLTINLDVAKDIVRQACFDAIRTTTLEIDDSYDPFWSPSCEGGKENDTDSAHCNINNSNSDEIEFKEFVSSTISRAISSIVAKSMSISPELSPQKSGTTKIRPLKRPRLQPGSKVEGLEHAESLHTMCSLFPVVMDSVESSASLQDSTKNGVRDLDLNLNSEVVVDNRDCESSSIGDHPSSPESYSNSNSNSNSNSHHSDHDSLLPPVGAPSATTTPIRPLRDTKAGTSGEVTSANVVSTKRIRCSTTPRNHQQQPQHRPRRITKALPPPVITTNKKTATTPMTLAQSNGRFPHKTNNDNIYSDIEDDESDCDCDYDYDRPLIGVVGDEGDNTDAIIRLTRVGSVVLHKMPPLVTARR